MSRRSRQRAGSGKNRSGWRVLAMISGGIVLALLIGYVALRSYLHGDGFRKFLSEKVSQAVGVKGEFAPFSWSGLALETEGFAADGNSRVKEVRASQLHSEVSLDGVKRGVWEIHGTVVDRLEISLDPNAAVNAHEEREAKEETPAVQRSKKSPWLPNEVELTDIDLRDVNLRVQTTSGEATANGVRVKAQQTKGQKSYQVNLSGGQLQLPMKHVPMLNLDHAKLHVQPDAAFLSEAMLNAEGGGQITANGEWEKATKRISLEGRLDGFRCENVLSGDWAKRLNGDLSSTFQLHAESGGELSSSGDLAIQNGTLTALPVLDALAAYADTRRFRVIQLNEAHTHWQWKKGELQLTNLVLGSEGLIRLEGDLVVRDGKLDGNFLVGIAPGILANIPGAEEDVFKVGEKSLLWAPLHLGGTVKDPEEDLTARLIAAAGVRMFEMIPETGAKALKYGGAVLGETPEETIRHGEKAIKKGEKAVREAKGILRDLLGE